MRFLLPCLFACCALHAAAAPPDTVDAAMDQVVTRLLAEKSPEQLRALGHAEVLGLLTPGEREALATRHVQFEVDAPVIVSVMREKKQEVLPFWLEEAGFQRTGLEVTNTEDWAYEVWQREFPAGKVGLGINGFDRHRPHYFVAIGPREPGAKFNITNLVPNEFSIGWMHEGAFVYHDWDSLLLKNVPEELAGHRLLTTIRGRARAAHLVGGFRETSTPSGAEPDQVLLTWSGDPRTTQAIQWRTSTAVAEGAVRYWPEDQPEQVTTVPAQLEKIEDRFLLNDRFCHHFTASLHGLEPATRYRYQAGHADAWSAEESFLTAPGAPESFTFITFGDTHKKAQWGQMLQDAAARHPEGRFYLLAGDLVDTGQYRDDWDQFIDVTGGAFASRPMLPCIGNHDSIDGLGAGMYRSLFALPPDGPEHLQPEHAYTITYGNVQFFVLDTSSPVIDQAAWLEQQLAASNADWKIAMFHFPPYNVDEPYPDIVNLWGYLFDKYHLDIALQGHMHYYMRSHPIQRNRPVEDPAEGTIHLMSIAIENRARDLPPVPYAAVQFGGTPLYQTFEVEGKRLTVKARDREGTVRDEFVLEK